MHFSLAGAFLCAPSNWGGRRFGTFFNPIWHWPVHDRTRSGLYGGKMRSRGTSTTGNVPTLGNGAGGRRLENNQMDSTLISFSIAIILFSTPFELCSFIFQINILNFIYSTE
jgi:hypothetical protein